MENIILFHEFKHHQQVTKHWLEHNQGQWNERTHLQLKTLGNSQFDYYVGYLTSIEIQKEIYDFLDNINSHQQVEYKDWIESNNGYREVSISDGSKWTLRYLDRDKYVHLHPSRYSKHTLRLNATILKTILCVLLHETLDKFSFNLNVINHHRITSLGMSPINIKAKHENIRRSFALFTNQE